MKSMTFTIIGGLFILGLIAGYFSGLVGIGGGVIIVPTLVLLFGFSQHLAQGTTVALLVPPIGILAAMEYYKNGNIDKPAALVICIGFILGGYIGGRMAIGLSETMLRRIFSIILIALGIRMFFFKS